MKSAFLYGQLKEEVYMQPPSEFSDGDKVWKLNRCLYGLKQSANQWYALFARFLATKGFTASTFDRCMFIHAKHDGYISLYVDDIAIYSADNPYLKSLIKDMKTAFEITDRWGSFIPTRPTHHIYIYTRPLASYPRTLHRYCPNTI